MRFARQLASFSLLLLTACSSPDGELTIAAAASVREVLTEMAERYTVEHSVPITVTTGSTGVLARQVREGAPCDVFFGADMQTAEGLAAEGFADGEAVAYAVGELVLWQHPESTPRIALLDDLRQPGMTVAIANAETAPYGAAAKELLGAHGLWGALKESVVFSGNVEQAFQYANSRNVTAAFVSRSLVPDGDEVVTFDDAAARVRHGAVVTLQGARSAHGAAFLDFVGHPDNAAVLARHGFAAP